MEEITLGDYLFLFVKFSAYDKRQYTPAMFGS